MKNRKYKYFEGQNKRKTSRNREIDGFVNGTWTRRWREERARNVDVRSIKMLLPAQTISTMHGIFMH